MTDQQINHPPNHPTTQQTLVAIILTRDEAAHIVDCIDSVRDLADTVIVWDSGSTDGTQDLAQAAGAQVVFRAFDNYAAQRQAALDAVNAEWVLFVDADERVTPALAAEIKIAIRHSPFAGYWIPRRNIIVGHEMRGGGFTPDHQLRLLRRDAAHYDTDREVHEIVEVDGAEGYLAEPFIHYNYANWPQFHRKQRVYAGYEARILAERGIRPRPHNFILQPLREFRRRFFTLHGYRDGLHGLRMGLLLAWYYGVVPYWVLLKRD